MYLSINAGLRKEAVALAVQACKWAAAAGGSEVVVWSAYDGYDYNLQVCVCVLCNLCCVLCVYDERCAQGCASEPANSLHSHPQ